MRSGEKHPPVSAKKIALRDLPSETNNFTSNPVEFSPLKDRGTILDTVKLCGTKREQPCSPCTPHLHQHSISNGHLVYVRRKLDTEPGKVCVENEECTDSLHSSNYQNVHLSDTNSPGEHETRVSGVPDELSPDSFISSLVSELPSYAWNHRHHMSISATDQMQLSAAPKSETQQGDGYWKERFIRLQMSLKNCDKYNQEKYIQSLRSLSAAGRSLHAVELEKRAIQLLLDEGKELQKMKLLNVLGKPLPNSHISLSTCRAFSPGPLDSDK